MWIPPQVFLIKIGYLVSVVRTAFNLNPHFTNEVNSFLTWSDVVNNWVDLTTETCKVREGSEPVKQGGSTLLF